MVNGFLTICSGVVLLQLSKSAKDVPDTAVFAGDLDQIQTIAEQPQPETEPKADAIRGAAAIVRRLSSARQKMELDELKRLHEEKLQESLEPVNENGVPRYEWDGIRRRRTGTFSTYGGRSMTSPAPSRLAPPTPHPPLGWSHFPTEEELAEANRPMSPALSNLMGTIRSRARTVILPGHPDFRGADSAPTTSKPQSPMHPVQLTSIAVPGSKTPNIQEYDPDHAYSPPGSAAGERSAPGSLSSSKRRIQFGGDNRQASNTSTEAGVVPPTPPPHSARRQFSFQNMFKRGGHGHGHDGSADSSQGHHRFRISARGYSSPQIVRDATEEERLGLVKGAADEARSMPALKHYRDDSVSSEDYYDEDEEEEEKYGGVGGYMDDKQTRYGHSITKGYAPQGGQGGGGSASPPRGAGGKLRKQQSPPPGQSQSQSPPRQQQQPQQQQRAVGAYIRQLGEEGPDELEDYVQRKRRFRRQDREREEQRDNSQPPPPPPPKGGNMGSFI